MIKFTVTSTKGGVGKTTLTANLGALLADMGLRVLLIDADVQPSLSKYFPLAVAKPAAGLTEVIVRGEVTAACITATVFPNLDIVVSDDPEGHLPNWLLNRIDRGFRLRFALQAAVVADAYDCVLIDTQGAIGPLQDAAVMAADILVLATPIWLGQHSSVAQRVLERLDAELSETDDEGRLLTFGKVAVVAVVGNEDGAHHIAAVAFQALNDVGFTIPTQGATNWTGEAMQGVDYKDLEETPEEPASATATLAANAAHLARLLRRDGYPAV